MIIHCQKCDKKFEILDSLIPDRGRLVECGFCNHQWNQSKDNENNDQLSRVETEDQLEKSLPSINNKNKDEVSVGEENSDKLVEDEVSLYEENSDKLVEDEVSIDEESSDKLIGDKSSNIKHRKEKFLDNKFKSTKNDVQKKIGFISYLMIFLITIISFVIILDTFQYQLSEIFPRLENYLTYIYETLNNIIILVKDLFKSY